jgi:hypothetical protein
MTDSLTLTPAIRGVSSADREAWLAQRRQGVTATEIATLAKGSMADWRRILAEKISGEQSFTGNQYTEHGNRREPLIAAWIEERFDIAPNSHVYSRGRYLATPDGISEDGILAEIKTSKHDLHPTRRGSHFTQTGYLDQMQWQLWVMDASECLFAWEQHDDAWPDPSPLKPEPECVWISRDESRIAFLVEVADRFLADLDAARITGGLPPVGDIPGEIADHVHRLLLARNAEAIAKMQKDIEWGWLQDELLAGEDLSMSNAEAKVTVSTTTKQTDVSTVDQAALEADPRYEALAEAVAHTEAQETAARTRADLARKALADLTRDFTTVASTSTSTQRLTVTALKSK